MEYVGEHLWVGNLGRLFVLLSFVSALVATFSYYKAEKQKDSKEGGTWKKMGRYAFLIQAISVFAVIGLIFYIMTEKMYEYAYAYNHVSDDLPTKYILSAFWEGQEGSFLLWMFWHVILGGFFLSKAKEWENGVMMFLTLIQAVLASFLIGVYVGGYKIGLQPFALLRDTMNIPLFNQADYLSKLTGTGLNPLLQNYWMTIHPPTLFLGFASVTIPFCFAGAGLLRKEYKSWLQPTLPWALFSGFILGTGILMGGAWAYEALNFGGYWAWDPVENMSLVPWLTLVAGIHMNLVARATGQAIRSTFAFYLASFVLVFYSTFLTRSGVLGDTSVHAFTELGLEAHLLIGLLLFGGISIYYYWRNRNRIPVPAKEEASSSKEFWMFIGALVLLISAVLISISTSFPVFNKLMDGVAWALGTDYSQYHIASPADPISHYNKHQIWIALFIGIFSGISQFLRYKERDFSKNARSYWTRTGITAGISIVLTVLSAQIINMTAWQYYALAFGCWYAIVSNLDYLIFVVKTNIKLAGSVFSHLGFGAMILGSLISGLNKYHISSNVFAQKGIIEGFDEEDYNKNVLLIKEKPMVIKGYEVTYERDTIEGLNRYFTVRYKEKDKSGKNTKKEFTLTPNVIYDKSFQKVAASNPDTKHYWDKDVFTHVASLPLAETDPEYARTVEDSLEYKAWKLIEGDTLQTELIDATFLGTEINASHPDYKPVEGDFAFGAKLLITDRETGKEYNVMPVAVIRGAKMIRFPVHITDLSVKVKVSKDIFEEMLWDDELKYKAYSVKKGSSFVIDGTKITFNGFNPNPKAKSYIPKEGDKAFNAMLDFERNGRSYQAKPIYFIREGMPYNIKHKIKDFNWHFKIGNIDPKSENVSILVAQAPRDAERITIKVAEGVPSNQYIVLEAIVFPGINLFWFGSILMLIGMLFAMFRRWFSK